MSDDKSYLSVKHLIKHYKLAQQEVPVLNDLSLQVKAGDSIAILGKSGSGKSTLLHLLARLDAPCSGEIWHAGNNLLKLKGSQLSAWRNQHVGFVYQQHHLLSDFSIHENVMLPLRLSGRSYADAKEQAYQALVALGLESKIDCRMHQLSGGQRQRVAIARASVTKPSFIFADEPTGSLDEKSACHVMEYLADCRQEMGLTMIVVTHDMKVASFMDHQRVLIDGKLLNA